MQDSVLKGIKFLFFGLLVFLLLASEFLVLFLDSFITGNGFGELNVWKERWYSLVLHWIITILIWGTGAFLVLSWLKRKGFLQQIFSFSLEKRFFLATLFAIAIALIFSFIESIFLPQKGFQIIREFSSFTKNHGRNAIILSIFQNLYYFFESFLVALILAFFQLAGELWFKLKKIPWGSLGLFLTWGMAHFISHPEGALFVAIFSLIPGFIYVLFGKNFYPTFLFVFLSFIF